MNCVQLVGRVGKRPERRGSAVKFPVATSRPKKKEDGTTDWVTDWHDCLIVGPSADRAELLDVGDTVAVIGEVQYNSVQSDTGTKRYTTIVARSCSVVSRGKGRPDDGIRPNAEKIENAERGVFGDDDLPF